MANPSYLFNDYVKDVSASSIAITNEDSGYPTENSQNEQVALTTRSTNKTNIKYQITLSGSKSLQAFAILNHNFSAATFDINSYTAADFSTGKIVVEPNKSIRLLDVYHHESSPPAPRQYWEFDFSNTASLDSYFEIGRIMVYDDWTLLSEAEDYEMPRGYGFINIINETKYGTKWVHKLSEKIEDLVLTWIIRKQSGGILTEVRTLFELTHGNAHPFLIIPDSAQTECYYGYGLEPNLKYVNIEGDHVRELELRFKMAVRGKA